MKKEEIAKRFDIDLKKLEKEQKGLAKHLKIKDLIDFDLIGRIGAVDNVFIDGRIISGFIVTDKDFEILEQEYATERVKFPYIPGFRAYRELSAMIQAFNKLEEKPDLVLIPGHGIAHPRLGIASHFSLFVNVPSIGIAKNLFEGEPKNAYIILNRKRVGMVIQTKKESRPIYVSPGNLISIETAGKIVKELVRKPHKLPEPLRIAHRYAKRIREELDVRNDKRDD